MRWRHVAVDGQRGNARRAVLGCLRSTVLLNSVSVSDTKVSRVLLFSRGLRDTDELPLCLVNTLDNDTVRIDFKPLYQCIHIYDTLDSREELQLSYQADRRVGYHSEGHLQLTLTSVSTIQAQAFLLLSQTASLTPLSLPALSALLEEIVGFFLIESHVLRTTNSFRLEQDVEDLWDGMCERVVRIVDEGLAGCEDPEIFLGTKFKVLTFVQTLEASSIRVALVDPQLTILILTQGYSYSVNQLNSLLLTLFERYSQLLQRKLSGDFEQVRPELPSSSISC
jgi:hypothetical protein